MPDWDRGRQRRAGVPSVMFSVVIGRLAGHGERKSWSSGGIVSMEGSRTITSVTHSISVCAEKLGKREVSRPRCSCGWMATWAYVGEKFARDAGQHHITQVLAQLQAVAG